MIEVTFMFSASLATQHESCLFILYGIKYNRCIFVLAKRLKINTVIVPLAVERNTK